MRINSFLAALVIALAFQEVAYGNEKIATSSGLSTPVAPTDKVQQVKAPREFVEIMARLKHIESGILQLTEKSDKSDYTPTILSIIGSLIGVFVGGFITVITQGKVLSHQQNLADEAAKNAKNLAEDKARLEIRNSFIQWRLTQLSELYGPLYALLQQSNAMYRHMNIVLQNADSTKFRLNEDSQGDDFDHKVFEIYESDNWVRFRTIMHIGKVYGQNYGIEAYFDDLVAIGGQIVEVIAKKAGYINPEQSELVSVFGKYLAHYSVLAQLHSKIRGLYKLPNQIKNPENPECDLLIHNMAVNESAVFPTELLGLVKAGFLAISQELNSWDVKVSN